MTTRIHLFQPGQWHQRLIFFLLVGWALAACQNNNNNNQDASRQLAAEGYLVAPEVFEQSIRATGDLLAWGEIEVKTPIAGLVHDIRFSEGQVVRKGELLVEMDNRSWQAQKRGLEARLQSARSELERRKGLLAIEGVSREEVERAQAEADLLQAQIEELEVMIDLAHVRAPFDGRLGIRHVSPGAFLSQGETITRLVQTGRLRVHFSVPARYASLVNSNMEVRVESSSGGQERLARVYTTEPVISASARSLLVRAELDNIDQQFFPGDFVQVVLGVERDEEALLIPAEAVISELNSQIVFVARNGQTRRQEIEAGIRTRDRVQVLGGLAPGDTVITTGLMEIRDGIPVVIRELKTGQAE